MSIYEVHPGSWRRHAHEDGEDGYYTYREFAVELAKYVKELRQHYKAVSQQIRAVSIPNCGNLHNWDRKLADMDAKKNAVFWICPLHVQMPDRILRDIKNRNARYRIIALNEEYGCCFNGFLTEKAE